MSSSTQTIIFIAAGLVSAVLLYKPVAWLFKLLGFLTKAAVSLAIGFLVSYLILYAVLGSPVDISKLLEKPITIVKTLTEKR